MADHVETSSADMPATRRWRQLASTAADDVRERIGRFAELSPRDREKLVRRLRDVIDSALDVPADLPARAARDAQRLRNARSDDDVVTIAWDRTRERARRTAAIGAVTAIPAVLPALGAPLAALGLVADWRFAAEQQRDLTLEIAALFGAMPDNPTEAVHALFLASAATAFGSTAAGDAVVRMLGRHIARRSVSRLVPGVGAVAAGTLNYVATVALGRAAIRHFAAAASVEVRGVFPEQVHPAMPWLRHSTVEAFSNDGVLRGIVPPFSDDDAAIITELSTADRDELLDLAVTAATGDGHLREERERLLNAIAQILGFDQDAVLDARSSTLEEVSRFANRIASLVSTAGHAGGHAAQTLWRRAGRLARRTLSR